VRRRGNSNSNMAKRGEVEKSTTKSSGRRQLPILDGIVITLILIGLFALPMLMKSTCNSNALNV